jgi:hypothetical protein
MERLNEYEVARTFDGPVEEQRDLVEEIVCRSN